MSLMFALGIGLLAIFVGVTGYEYGHTTGTFVERIFHAVGDSMTILWARAIILWSIILQIALASTVVGADQMSDMVKSLLRPEYVPIVTIVIMVIVEVARRRSLEPK